jgi:sulfite reductase (NADPH) flavoprotein alpha-component
MLRRLHSLPGLLAALFLLILATSGAVLSLSPALERVAATVPARGDVSVADVAARVLQTYPGAEQIERLPSGAVLVYFSVDGNPGADLVDPLTGARLAAYEPPPFFTGMKDLHRAFLLDDPGRAAAGVGAVLMVLMCFSGAFLLASRAGGWRKLLAPIRGTGSQRLHTELARAAVVGLLISALSGAWMSAIRFEWLAEAEELEAEFPAEVAGTPPAPIGTLQALQAVDLRDLHQLIMPFPDDPLDVYSLRTHQGSGFVDQATGQWLSYSDYGSAATLQTFIMELHTGEAYWWLGLILGVAALTVPVLAVTGVLIWWQRRRSMPRLSGNAAASSADTLLLVGSETNATWGFAKTLHDGLTAAGCQVHVAPLNQWSGRYPKAQRLLVLTSTYGDGDAPASASQFQHRLASAPGSNPLPWAVLGFGDRQFDNFCAFADQVAAALEARQWPRILATDYVDRQSGQTFERWCSALGSAIAMPLDLQYTPMRHATRPLVLAEREDYGSAVKAPTSILRFKAAPPHRTLPSFVAGDLVGILPPGSDIPRFYSLASASKDGVLEICVKRQEHGVCSTFLCDMKIGDCADGFIQKNPRFQPARAKGPVILIGAGTGIGPLAGFIRANKSRRPMHLFWGGRLAQSDFLYEHPLQEWLADQRLSGLHTAFSRCPQPAYVQDKLREDSAQVLALLASHGQILVCGGRRMAGDVTLALDEMLAPQNLSVAMLKKAGRYIEDTY